jgi:hypothetical protein
MKHIPVLVVVLLSCACTTLRSTEASPADLQRMITQENLLKPGDRVKLVTADGSVHAFRVTQIDVDDGLVIGKEESVPIADIIAVETREVSVGKTAALTGGLVGVYLIIAILGALAAGFAVG